MLSFLNLSEKSALLTIYFNKDHVTINLLFDRPCCKRGFNPALNLEPVQSVGDKNFTKKNRGLLNR